MKHKSKRKSTTAKQPTQSFSQKKKQLRKQNTDQEEYWIDNIPLELTELNYSRLINNSSKQQNENKTNLDQQKEHLSHKKILHLNIHMKLI